MGDRTLNAVNGDLTFVARLGRSGLGILAGLADKLPYILIALLFLLLTFWAARLTSRLVRAALARTSTEGHVDVLLAKLAGAAVFAVGAIVALGIAGVQVTALVASLGLAGVTIGFALKDVLANSMAGVLLLLQRPFTIGDSVSVAGCEGTVRDIRVRDTLIEQADGRMVFVPNATVFNAPITNTSVAPLRRVEVKVHVPLDADLAAARACVRGALEGVPGRVQDAPVEALYVRSGVTSAVLAARVWIDTADEPFAKANDAAIAAVIAAVRSAGIELASAE
jgi:small conductance mechanosensitive channel